jgi:hypothetical protein
MCRLCARPSSTTEAAKRDHDQYDVVAIHRQTGDPEFRKSVKKYLIEYAAGDSKWMFNMLNVQYADYVKRFRDLELSVLAR